MDNSPHAYGYQIDNGIPIVSWYDDDKDTELLKLIGFLKKISGNNMFASYPTFICMCVHYVIGAIIVNAYLGH